MYINYHLLFVYFCNTFVACNDGQETCLSEEIEDSPEEKNGEENELESETKYGDDIVQLTSDDACTKDTKTNEQTENVDEDIGKKPPNTPNKRNSFFSELSEKLRSKNSSDNGIAEGNNSKRNSLENKDDIYDHTDFEGNSEKTLGVGEAGADNGKSGKEEAHDKSMKDKNAKAQTIGVGKEEFERKKKELGSKLGGILASRINNNATVNKPASLPETVNGDLKNVSKLAPASSHTITTLAPPPPPYPGNFSRPPNNVNQGSNTTTINAPPPPPFPQSMSGLNSNTIQVTGPTQVSVPTQMTIPPTNSLNPLLNPVYSQASNMHANDGNQSTHFVLNNLYTSNQSSNANPQYVGGADGTLDYTPIRDVNAARSHKACYNACVAEQLQGLVQINQNMVALAQQAQERYHILHALLL